MPIGDPRRSGSGSSRRQSGSPSAARAGNLHALPSAARSMIGIEPAHRREIRACLSLDLLSHSASHLLRSCPFPEPLRFETKIVGCNIPLGRTALNQRRDGTVRFAIAPSSRHRFVVRSLCPMLRSARSATVPRAAHWRRRGKWHRAGGGLCRPMPHPASPMTPMSERLDKLAPTVDTGIDTRNR